MMLDSRVVAKAFRSPKGSTEELLTEIKSALGLAHKNLSAETIELAWKEKSHFALKFSGLECSLELLFTKAEIVNMQNSNEILFQKFSDALLATRDELSPPPKFSDAHGDEDWRDFFDQETDLATTELSRIIAERALVSPFTTVLGHSSSGKTTAALQACSSLNADRNTLIKYYDLSRGLPNLNSLVEFAITGSTSNVQDHLIVIDNLQSQLSSAPIWKTLSDISNSLHRSHLILIAWPSAKTVIEKTYPTRNSIIHAIGDHVLGEILYATDEEIPQRDQRNIIAKANGDVLLGRQILEKYKASSAIATSEELSDWLTAPMELDKLGESSRACLQALCAVNSIDVPVRLSYLSEKFPDGVEELARKKSIFRVEGEFVRVGHRSKAQLILHSLQKKFGSSTEPLSNRDPVAQSILNYLKTLRRDELYPILTNIDASLEFTRQRASEISGFSDILRSIATLIARLELSVAEETDWGNNYASAVFASMALAWGAPVSWKKVGDWLRGRVEISGGKLKFSDGHGSERADFNQIKQKMIEEDHAEFREKDHWVDPENVDLDRMYQSWLVGLLLCSEGTAPVKDFTRIKSLVEVAESLREPGAGYHPTRVPWVSARVLLGLGMVGEYVDSNDWVSDVARWMLSTVVKTDAGEPWYWESGTGTWNSKEQCTAMCALALREVGVPHGVIASAETSALLKQSLASFEIDQHEIDILLTLEYLSEFDRFDSECDALLKQITDKYVVPGTGLKTHLNPENAQNESSKIPFVLFSLINILWDRVANSLGQFAVSIAPRNSDLRRDRLSATDLEDRWAGLELVCSALIELVSKTISDKQTTQLRAKSMEFDDPSLVESLSKLNDVYSSLTALQSKIAKRDNSEGNLEACEKHLNELEGVVNAQ